jgi:hypothetical protein
MSGPIVRKYGFPNFEKIFGERPLEHGLEEDERRERELSRQRSEAAQEASQSGTETPQRRNTKPEG